MAAEYRQEGKGLRFLPELDDAAYDTLTALYLGDNCLREIPQRVLQLLELRILDLTDNELDELSRAVGRLAKLESVHLSRNRLTSLPLEFFTLGHIATLDLASNKLVTLPPYLSLLSNLKSLDLSHNELGSLPEEFCLLSNLTTLNVSHNRLSRVPLGSCLQLQTCMLQFNLLSSLPVTIAAASNLAYLDASHNLIHVFPELAAPRLKLLDLGHNRISSVAPSLAALTAIERLYLGHNYLSQVPPELEQLVNLMEFSFRHNRIVDIPKAIEEHPFSVRAFEDNPHLGDDEFPALQAPPNPHSRAKTHQDLASEHSKLAVDRAAYEFVARLHQLKERERQVREVEDRQAKLDALSAKLDALSEKLSSGLTVSAKNVGSSRVVGGPSLDELKREIEELQKVVFSDTATPKEVNDANIRLEKAMAAFEQHPESKEAVRKAQEERRAKNDPLNREALGRMREKINATTLKANPDLLKHVGENAELKLLLMEPETILRLHPTDFKTFTLKNLNIDELRAIRAALPKFRKDQHIQLEWVDQLDEKIDTVVATQLQPRTPRKPAKKLVFKKPAAGEAGDFLTEMMARKGRAATVSYGAPAAAAKPPAPLPVPSVAVSAPRPGPAPPVSPRGGALPPGVSPRPVPAAGTPRELSPSPAKKSAGAAISALGDAIKAGFDSESPPMPSRGLSVPADRLQSVAAAASAAAAAAAATSAGASSAMMPELLQQFEEMDTALQQLLEFASKGDADVAADTRTAVARIKQLAESCRARNAEAAGVLEGSAGDLVSAIKRLLMSRNPVARISLGSGDMSADGARENLEEAVMQVREKAANALC